MTAAPLVMRSIHAQMRSTGEGLPVLSPHPSMHVQMSQKADELRDVQQTHDRELRQLRQQLADAMSAVAEADAKSKGMADKEVRGRVASFCCQIAGMALYRQMPMHRCCAQAGGGGAVGAAAGVLMARPIALNWPARPAVVLHPIQPLAGTACMYAMKRLRPIPVPADLSIRCRQRKAGSAEARAKVSELQAGVHERDTRIQQLEQQLSKAAQVAAAHQVGCRPPAGPCCCSAQGKGMPRCNEQLPIVKRHQWQTAVPCLCRCSRRRSRSASWWAAWGCRWGQPVAWTPMMMAPTWFSACECKLQAVARGCARPACGLRVRAILLAAALPLE